VRAAQGQSHEFPLIENSGAVGLLSQRRTGQLRARLEPQVEGVWTGFSGCVPSKLCEAAESGASATKCCWLPKAFAYLRYELRPADRLLASKAVVVTDFRSADYLPLGDYTGENRR
jgi:hypothetical protein